MTVEAGSQIAHYEIHHEIGRGGMGVVYLARDTKLDRDVAIKVIPEDVADDAERLARFEREAKLLASLHHANIAGVYGLEESGGRRYLTGIRTLQRSSRRWSTHSVRAPNPRLRARWITPSSSPSLRASPNRPSSPVRIECPRDPQPLLRRFSARVSATVPQSRRRRPCSQLRAARKLCHRLKLPLQPPRNRRCSRWGRTVTSRSHQSANT